MTLKLVALHSILRVALNISSPKCIFYLILQMFENIICAEFLPVMFNTIIYMIFLFKVNLQTSSSTDIKLPDVQSSRDLFPDLLFLFSFQEFVEVVKLWVIFCIY